MAATSVRANSVPMDDENEESELQSFMKKYEEKDRDRKKYMICFFTLFGLIIIFLIIILVGLTSANRLNGSNIDTCHTNCASTNNEFVTLTESDTDAPIATYNAYLDLYLQDTNLTNYTRIKSVNGSIIEDLNAYSYEIKEGLGLDGGDEDIYIPITYEIFRGNIEYNYLVQSCDILYTGHSSFTLRVSVENKLSTSTLVATVQVTSEECDSKISNGLPTTLTFEINEDSYFFECLYGDKGLCQVYRQITRTYNVNNITENISSLTSNNSTRRRLQIPDGVCSNNFEYSQGTKAYMCSIDSERGSFRGKSWIKNILWSSDTITRNARLYTESITGCRFDIYGISLSLEGDGISAGGHLCEKGYTCRDVYALICEDS